MTPEEVVQIRLNECKRRFMEKHSLFATDYQMLQTLVKHAKDKGEASFRMEEPYARSFWWFDIATKGTDPLRRINIGRYSYIRIMKSQTWPNTLDICLYGRIGHDR